MHNAYFDFVKRRKWERDTQEKSSNKGKHKYCSFRQSQKNTKWKQKQKQPIQNGMVVEKWAHGGLK